MDNNAFEKHMIDFVNTNAKTAANEREDQFQRDLDKWKARRKAEKIRAIVEMMCWVLCFITLVVAFGVLSWLDAVPTELAIAIPAVFGFMAGIRVCGLVNKI